MNPDQGIDPASLPGDWLSIREMEKITGVSAATLRAWEYRYGLIMPRRTPRGHRLYAAAQVRQVQDVLACLKRGVPENEVTPLLQRRADSSGGPA